MPEGKADPNHLNAPKPVWTRPCIVKVVKEYLERVMLHRRSSVDLTAIQDFKILQQNRDRLHRAELY